MKYENTRQTHTALVNSGAVRAIIDFRKLTLREAAKLCGVSIGTIHNVASGKVNSVNPSTAGKIAGGLGVATESLFTLKFIPSVTDTGNRLSA